MSEKQIKEELERDMYPRLLPGVSATAHPSTVWMAVRQNVSSDLTFVNVSYIQNRLLLC